MKAMNKAESSEREKMWSSEGKRGRIIDENGGEERIGKRC